MEDLSMYELVLKAAKAEPKMTAIYYRGKKISYKKFMNLVDKTASIFYNTLGIRENDIILISQPNIPDTLIMFYALNKIGAVVNFLHPFTPYNQLLSVMSKTNSKYAFLFEQRVAKEVAKYREISDRIFVTRVENYLPFFSKIIYHFFMNFRIRKKLGKFHNQFKGFNYVHKLKYEGKPIPESTKKNSDCSIILHSGSTTGEPKSICLSNNNFNYIASKMFTILGRSWEETKGMKMLTVLPSFHGFGLEMCMHIPLISNMGCILVPKFSVKEATKILNKLHYRIICGVPTMYEKLFNYQPFVKSKYLKDMYACYSGGDGFNQAKRAKINGILEKAGSVSKIYEGYGLTEAIAVNCVNTNNHYKDGSIGYPIEGAEFKIVDEKGKELKQGEIGEICIKSGAVMIGYYKDVDATKECLKDGWLYTGDLGYIDEDGFLFFKSRKKRVVKVSGVAVFPSEIEKLIASIPRVSAVAAIQIPDDKLQNAIKVFVVADYFDEEGMRSEILENCRKYLIRWAVPKEIEFRKELPTTKLGKIDFKKLQEEENNKKN